MIVVAKYCSIRSVLEEHAFSLTAKLFDLIERLHGLVGTNYQEFLAALVSCHTVKKELSESRQRLEVHRAAHGC
jgi:hypothetical protein